MTELVRTLKLRDLSLLIIGAVIGSGIFLVPGGVLSQVKGNALLALAVWLAGGLLSLLGALTYGELSAMNPKAGGLYVYIRDCFGRLPAFLFGWALFFAICGGAVATLAVAFSDNLSEVVPLPGITAKFASVGMILVVTAVNVWGTRRSADLQNWTTAIKVGALILMSVVLLYMGRGFTPNSVLDLQQNEGSLASGFGLAMIGVLWAYEGWQYGTFSAGETIDAQRNFPRAFLIGMSTLICVYLLANMAYLWALSPAEVALSKSVAATAISATAGAAAAKLVALVIAISIFSATNATVLTGSRVYYAMARDGLFFQRLAEVHPRFGTPAFAVIAGAAWAAILAMLGDFQQLLTYVVFAGWIFYGLGASALFVYRRRMNADDLPYRVPGYPWTPLLFVLAAAALVVNTVATQIVQSPMRTLIAVGIILLGVPAYFIWRARNRAELTAPAQP